MELARLDLNLLLVFHHLLREKRVSAVATVLGMSQPAVSSALGRLRTHLDDELFLRTQHGMAPTPYALQLANPWPWRSMACNKRSMCAPLLTRPPASAALPWP